MPLTGGEVTAPSPPSDSSVPPSDTDAILIADVRLPRGGRKKKEGDEGERRRRRNAC